MQFLKLQKINGCCTSQASGETRILEWCTMSPDELWDKLYFELDVGKYISKYISANRLKTIRDAIFEAGRVKNNKDCDSCVTLYLFQPLASSLNKRFNIDGRKTDEINHIISSIASAKFDSDKENLFDYVKKNYNIPLWAKVSGKKDDEYFMDWLDGITKDGKYIRDKSKSGIIKDDKYIYSNELYKKVFILTDYFLTLTGHVFDDDITDEDIDVLLSIKMNDIDWFDKWTIPQSDQNSNELFFKKYTYGANDNIGQKESSDDE
jgi:hypothetical protein